MRRSFQHQTRFAVAFILFSADQAVAADPHTVTEISGLLIMAVGVLVLGVVIAYKQK